MSKILLAKYYQENKKKKKKSDNMFLKVTNISQKIKNKSLLSTEKNILE